MDKYDEILNRISASERLMLLMHDKLMGMGDSIPRELALTRRITTDGIAKLSDEIKLLAVKLQNLASRVNEKPGTLQQDVGDTAILMEVQDNKISHSHRIVGLSEGAVNASSVLDGELKGDVEEEGKHQHSTKYEDGGNCTDMQNIVCASSDIVEEVKGDFQREPIAETSQEVKYTVEAKDEDTFENLDANPTSNEHLICDSFSTESRHLPNGDAIEAGSISVSIPPIDRPLWEVVVEEKVDEMTKMKKRFYWLV